MRELPKPAALLVAAFMTTSLLRANVGRELWDFINQYADKDIVEYEVESAKFNIPLSDTRALASDGINFWTVESFNGSRQVFQLGLNFEPLKSYRTPANAISGIAYDGKFYWSSDVNSDRIYKHDRDWQVLKTIRAPVIGYTGWPSTESISTPTTSCARRCTGTMRTATWSRRIL